MVSVSLWPTELDRPMAIDEWTQADRRIAEKIAMRALGRSGVVGSDVESIGTITLIVRRQCSDIERRRVVEKYLKS